MTHSPQLTPPAVVEDYLAYIESGQRPAVCDEQRQFVLLVRNGYAAGNIYTDEQLLAKYLSLERYFPFKLFPWERCLTALFLCTFYCDTGLPRWSELFLYVARGSGKNALMAYWAFCATSPYNPVGNYDIDFVAPSEQQAERSFNDVWEVCETPKNTKLLKQHYRWTKSIIVGRKNRGRIQYRTSNPRSKDGLRSGCVMFDELHDYEDYKLIEVFTTGLGKTGQPRRVFASTDGQVRAGPLDDIKSRGRAVLSGEQEDDSLLPFMCAVADKAAAGDEAAWYAANPSLEYLPSLLAEYRLEYKEYQANPRPGSSFIVKRLNCVDVNTADGVTSWANIVRASAKIPDLTGYAAIAALDYARLRDFAAAGFWVRAKERRYWISHSWVCLRSPDLERIKAPWRDWVDQGLLTAVDAPEIAPELLTAWLAEEGAKYDVRACAIDGFRYALMRSALADIGFAEGKDGRNKVRFVSRAALMQAATIVDSQFTNGTLAWGEKQALMQWYTNNASARLNDKGNIEYGKQEPVTRKTDGFFAMVAGATLDGLLPEDRTAALRPLPVITF